MKTHTLRECRAQDPTTCKYHGNPKRKPKLSFTQFFNLRSAPPITQPKPVPYGSLIQDRDEKYREQILADIDLNRKLRIDPKTGTKTVSIYRSGKPEAPTERGVEKAHYQYGDDAAPAGRQGRTTGVFASANMDTALRWYRANGQTWSHIEDYGLRELRVNPDITYIYSVRNWEKASGALGGDIHPNPDSPHFKAAIQKYWEQSMTLTDWYQYVKDNPDVDTRDWEVLTHPDHIQKITPVGPKRILDSSIRDWEKSELTHVIKREQQAKRAHKTAA